MTDISIKDVFDPTGGSVTIVDAVNTVVGRIAALEAANTVHYGSGAPSNGLGANGDLYIDTSAHYIYGPKSSGVWPAGVSLVGPAGPTGRAGPTGPAGPTGATGPAGPTGFSRYVFNPQSGTTYTVLASDVTSNGNIIIVASNTSSISITVPTPTSLGASIGDSFTVVQGDAGIITLVGGSGSTLTGTAAFTGPNEAKTLIADSSASWRIIGG